jgi:actin-related protein 8
MEVDVDEGAEYAAAALPAEPTAATTTEIDSSEYVATMTLAPGGETPMDILPELLLPTPSNEPTIDIAFEASKLPLDVAIFNSARAAGGDEKIRKYLQAVLILGGGSMVPGMAHALESRLVY